VNRFDAQFAAISDPTRRSILDLLLEKESLTAGEIASAIPQISRPAVSKHLRVLRESGLVKEKAIGRERHYRINPEPFRFLYEEWFVRYERLWNDKLLALKNYLESVEDERGE
jgi:DNA-binding transcriptional ArsR family regulator